MKSFPRWLLVASLLAMSILMAGGYWFHLYQEHHVRRSAEANLEAAAHLKVNQIVQWRIQHLRNASAIVESPFLIEAVERWFVDPDPEVAAKILSRFQTIQRVLEYHNVILVERDNKVRLSLRDHASDLHEVAAKARDQAMQQRKPVMTDLHEGPEEFPPHVDIIAPFFSRTANTEEPIGAVVLQVDARHFLYPLIHFWPVKSSSAETLLVRKDDEAVLFLNELRHQTDTALKLRLPLTMKDLPASMAVSGIEGVVQGTDYRGVEVLAALKAVPDSSWFMISKMDIAEALADLRTRSLLSIAFVLVLLAFLVAAVGWIWQQHRKKHYKELLRAEMELRRVEERHRITLMSVGDAIISTDIAGRVEMINPVAESLTGWNGEDAIGKPLEQVFRILNEDTRNTVENPASKVLREGLVIGLANHTLLIARNGTERPIADSAAPIKDEDGVVTGVVLVFRDQSEERATQRLLIEEKEKAQHYLDVAGVMLLALDVTGRVTMVNKKGCEILDRPETDILGKDWFEHFIPETIRYQIKDRFREVITGSLKDSEYAENMVLTGRGKNRLIAWHNSILMDRKGAIVGTLSSGEDITVRRGAEQALRESEERFRRLYEQSPLPYQSLDAEGRLLDVNNAWLNELGYERTDVIGKSFGEFLANDGDASRFPDHFEQLKQEGEGHGIEFEMKRKDGAIITVLFEARVAHNDKGEFLQTHCIFTNVTETRRAEVERERLVSAIEQAGEAVVVTDIAGTILFVNPAFEKITGYAYEEAVGKNPRILQSGEHEADFYKRLWDTIRAGEIWTGRFINKRKDGRIYQEDATISPVKDSAGHIRNYVAVKHDITEHLELSRQLQQAQKMEAVGTLAGGVAHDFNNLLQVILGYSEMILTDEGLSAAHKADLSKICHAAKSGADLVQRLLTFSRKSDTKAIQLNLNNRVEQLEKMLSRTIPKMIDIEISLAEDCKTIYADPMQIEQVLMNLAINARDAMPEGGKLVITTENVTVHEDCAKTRLGQVPGDYVLLRVTDTGLGMDSETLEHIFEPFYTTKGPGEGTGLGLAMVYGIVKQHGGYIFCYSEPGEGTTFKLYFPAVESDAEPDKPKAAQFLQGGSETILVVDDDELIRELGLRILSKLGYKVILASNGKEALKIFRKQKREISLIIMDLIMPEMGGKQCLEEILKIDPKAKILIASGVSARSHIIDIDEAGVKGIVNKPYDMTELFTVVRETLDAK
ncbi:hybrid sensor histidine kinase/response regulator [Desulfomonile tiedjei]|uniref:histidine kinase n=1 Tax=Desulfomonile tiedjei (strain ATCC 49306 / DSM 6799 / DCB-1) TaxID=706587 RepID=I4C8N8_DESTA|nr:PAS domain S-box protein [Desulfomonile tiedjei]AFM25929.1 PAS domain S-box [Desulfomonile tiedjei DSM 6799]